MLVYRMHGLSYDAFDTTGAFLQAGRWHPAGVRVIYAAEHVSLAVLETLIHAGGKKIPPRALTPIRIPDDLHVEDAGWMDFPKSQWFGESWVREQRSAVLKVSSIAVNKLESNFVFNPRHSDFARVERGASAPFEFNPRFFAL